MKFRPGLTLLELLVSIFVLGLVVTIVGNLFITSVRFFRDENLRIEVGESASRVLGVMDETLRQAKNVLASATINSVNYTTDTDTLVFSIPSLLAGGSLSPTEIDSGVILFDTTVANHPHLRLIIAPGGSSTRSAVDREIVAQVKDVYFRYTSSTPSSATAVTATVQVEQSIGGRSFTRTNIIYVTFRNHP